MSDHSTFLAAMYQDDDDEPQEAATANPGAPAPARGIMNMPAMSSEIRRLQQQVEDQARTIRRLETMMSQMRRVINKHGTSIDNAHRDIAGKMDSY